MNEFKMTQKLLDSDPFDFSSEEQKLFRESFKEMALHHYQAHPFFKKIFDEAGIHPSQINSEADMEKVPAIMVHLFKEKEFLSVPEKEVVLTLTSSGTGGQKSQQRLDQLSLDNVKHLAYKVHEALGMTSSEEVNYLCFTYDPKVASDLGTAFTDELLTSFTGRAEVYYAIQWREEKNDFELNTDGVVETLKRFEKAGRPVRILGFPAFLYKILKDYHIKLTLPANSWVQTGGGWKNLANEEIPKAEFRRFIFESLGIPEENCRDLFGMVEHGIPYVDCRLGNMHVPNYARVYVRSPHDLSLLPEGEIGLLHFICSYNHSYPCISLLSTDYGRLGKCKCGLGGHILELKGRAGISKHKGCAIKAAELLK